MPPKWTPIRKYLLIMALCQSLVPLSCGLNYLFLKKSLEFENINDIVQKQFQSGAYYLSAVRHVLYPYKLSLIKKVKPTVVVLGSSRVQKFRGSYFTVPFVNGSSAAHSFVEVENLLKEMIADHKPEVVILGLDPWWFIKERQGFGGFPTSTGEEFEIDMIFLPWEWLLQGKVSPGHYFQVLTGKNLGPLQGIGVKAATELAGFSKDGSLFAPRRLGGLIFFSEDQRRFSHVIGQIARGESPFIPNQVIDRERWQEFVSLLQFAQREDIRLLVFLPPLPCQVIDLLLHKSEKYAYINEVRRRLAAAVDHYYDFFDPSNIGSRDSEFLDGLHAGEVTHLRILEKIGQDPASGLSPYLDRRKISACIEQYQDNYVVPSPF